MQSVTVLFSVNEKMAEKRKRTDLSLADKVKVVNMFGDKLTQTEIATRLGILLFHNGRVFITLRNRYSRLFCTRVFFSCLMHNTLYPVSVCSTVRTFIHTLRHLCLRLLAQLG